MADVTTEPSPPAAAQEPSDAPKFAQIPGVEERRKTARKTFFVMGQIALPTRGPMAVRYLDISTGGVGLVSDLNIPARTRVHLKFTIMLADSSFYPFVVQAEVAHSTFSSLRRGFVIGLIFLNPTDELLMTIKQYIAS
ncbi:MAG: PilZ domain-containing protein [Betaproteobacteria bacterium]|nr:PilZ domain-containing protein [Betaproteobacteria bacterium]